MFLGIFVIVAIVIMVGIAVYSIIKYTFSI